MTSHLAGSKSPSGATRLLLAFLISVAGCTHANTAVAPGGDPMVVTEDQIDQLRVTTAYDIVAQTHANFLHSRGRESQNPNVPPTPAHVYVDNTYYSNDVASLREIDAHDVMEIRFYQSYEAQYKFGSGHLGGVIQVITKN
ncbi:MAG: hypothetical protein ABI311_00815 [Gemmatimonadaceae bacterium]